jgi:hypothetical protein
MRGEGIDVHVYRRHKVTAHRPRVEIKPRKFLSLVLTGGELLTSRSDSCSSEERARGTHWIRPGIIWTWRRRQKSLSSAPGPNRSYWPSHHPDTIGERPSTLCIIKYSAFNQAVQQTCHTECLLRVTQKEVKRGDFRGLSRG